MTTNPEMQAAPPRWAEAVLRMSLKRADRDTVSGDLLEEYRDAIVPARGKKAADRWYLRQAAGFLLRAAWVWAALFSGAFVLRQAFDFLVPTHDFSVRSTVTTYTAIALLAVTSFWAAWRSRSFAGGIVVTVAMTSLAAVLSIAGVSVLLAIWHDPATLQAAADSGGIAEAYVLPFMMIVPALVVGTVGASIGRWAADY